MVGTSGDLMFPVGFDFNKGLRDAEGNIDLVLRRIQQMMNQKPVTIKMDFDTSKFPAFAQKYTQNIDSIQESIQRLNEAWSKMRFSDKFDANGNLTERAQSMISMFQQLTTAAVTYGQTLSEVNRKMQKDLADTEKAIAKAYQEQDKAIQKQIAAKEREAAAAERVRQAQLKSVNVGYVETERQVQAVNNLRLQYEAILPTLNNLMQKRVDLKVRIDNQFKSDIERLNILIDGLRQKNLALGAKGDANAIQANIQAIQQLEAEIDRINRQKIDLFNNNAIHQQIRNLTTEVVQAFEAMQNAERKLASDNALNSALDAQGQKVLQLNEKIRQLDAEIARLNATGRMYNTDGSFTNEAIAKLQERMNLTKQLTQESISGSQAQAQYERQLQKEKQETDRIAREAAREAARLAKEEEEARRRAQAVADAENKARQAAYNARKQQGREIQRALKAEETSIDAITKKLQIQMQRLYSAKEGSAKFGKIAEEVKRLTKLLEEAKNRMNELTGKIATGSQKQADAVKKVNEEFSKQNNYLQNVIRRMATYASLGAIGGFLQKVREVTAEFELQRVSLGAIIQDQNRANALFSEIKNYALKSPVKILDLTRYTKQLAAYQIETDKLFETTKRLTDVSVGLGVDMSRLILAYGETKASHVLNAKELRQFAMMGIPMLELLSEKLSELNHKTITTAETFEMIKKRMVGFDIVSQVFEDLTNKGGIFYNMQEKQGNTLYGMWAKLGDAASVMYDSIGNTAFVQAGMRGFIQVLRSMMLAWRDIGRVIATVAVGFLAFKVNAAWIGHTMNAVRNLANANNALAMAQHKLNIAQQSGNKLLIWSNQLYVSAAKTRLNAAKANNIFAASCKRVGAAIKSMAGFAVANAPMLAVTAILAAWQWIDSINEKANRLKNALKDIQQASFAEQQKSVQNFESLVNKAISYPKGSKESRDALEELHNTYGKIIAIEDLQIDKLKKMEGNYGLLTQAIRENIAEQKRQEGITTILDEYAEKLKKAEDALKKQLGKGISLDIGNLKFNDEQASRIVENYKSQIKKMLESGEDIKTANIGEALSEAFKLEGIYFTIENYKQLKTLLQGNSGAAWNLAMSFEMQEKELKKWDNSAKQTYATLGKLADLMKEAQDRIANHQYTNEKGTYTFDEEVAKTTIDSYLKELKQAFAQAGIKINLNDFITFDDDGDVLAIDWDGLLAKIDTFTEQLTAKEQALIAKREAYKKQFEAETAKGKDADEKRAQQYLARANMVANELGQLVNPQALKDNVGEVQKIFEDLVPKDAVVAALKQRLELISTTMWGNLNKGMDAMRKYSYDGKVELRKQVKDWKEELDILKQNIYQYSKLVSLGWLTNERVKTLTGQDLEEMRIEFKALEKYIADAEKLLDPSLDKSKKGHKSDPRLQILNNIASTMEKINKEYDDLLKKEGQTRALADTQRLFAEELDNLQKIAQKHGFKLPKFEIPTSAADVKKWYDAVAAEIRRLKLPQADRILIDLGFKANKMSIDELQRHIEQRLRELSDKIAASKTAREFYDKILTQTGDVDIAASVTMSIYGDTGEGLQSAMAQQIREMFAGYDVEVPVNVITANDRINYRELEKYVRKMQTALGGVDSKTYQELLKIAQQGEKDWAKTYQGYLKDLEKAKTYSQQRIELARITAQKILEIRNSELPDEEKQRLITGYNEKEMQDAAKLEWEAFKDTPMYVEMFADLDYASTTMLRNMQSMLERLKGQWGESLNPTQLKEMQSRLEDIGRVLATRNPFGAIGEGIANIRELNRLYGSEKKAEQELAAATADLISEKNKLNLLLEAQTRYEQMLQDIQNQYGNDSVQAEHAQEQLDAVKGEVKAQKNAVDLAEKRVKNAEKTTNAYRKSREEIAKGIKGLKEYVAKVKEAYDAVRACVEEWSALGNDELWNAIMDGMDMFVNSANSAFDAAASYMSGDMFGAITSGVSALSQLITGIGKIFNGAKIAAANREIERQNKILHDLEYSYDRLQKAQERLFGTEWIQNYNTQLTNLQAQAAAYEKQLKAEKSKGKKADEDAMQDYEDKWRDTMDEIKDMRDDLQEYMLGTDLTSAARDWANAWLDARWSFEDTTEAMKEKFADMVQSMIVESMAAKIMEVALKPVFDSIDELSADGELSAEDIAKIAERGVIAMDKAGSSMEAMMATLEAAGINLSEIMNQGDSDLTGISRDIASASEESINGLAQGINTQNFYMFTINENVAAIRGYMEASISGTLGIGAEGGMDLITMQNEHLSQLPIIAANTLATAERCERAALACEAIQAAVERVVDFKGNKAVVNTALY